MSYTAVKNLDNAQSPMSSTGYNVSLTFGRSRKQNVIATIPIDDSVISDFTITLDLNHMLPMFNLKLSDSANIAGHKQSPDRDILTLRVQLGSVWNTSPGEVTTFDLITLRTSPDASRRYHITGVLDVPDFYTPTKCRSFSGNISETLQQLADEMGLKNNEISGSLAYPKKILQPFITNGQLLNWMESYMEGKNKESGYYTYIKPKTNSSSLVFKPINEFLNNSPKYDITTTDTARQNPVTKSVTLPILDYKAVGNYGIQRATGGKAQTCGYFDYDTGTYIVKESKLNENDNINQDIFGLTSHYLVDHEDTNVSSSPDFTSCRTNDKSSNFVYKTSGYLSKKMLNLSKLWVTTWGTHNLYPGDVINVPSLDPIGPAELYRGQFTGKWMVERVVHTFDLWHRTKLLLTRSGANVDVATTLEEVLPKNRKAKR